jgi:integrase
MPVRKPQEKLARPSEGWPISDRRDLLLFSLVPSIASDPVAAAYLLKVLEKEGISHDVAIKHLIAHSASFKCPRLGILIRELVLAQRHRKTGHSQMRHVRMVLVAFFHYLPRDHRDHPGTITREDVVKFLARYDKMAVKTWNEAFAYITGIFALAVKRGWLVVSPCASIQRKPKPRHRPPPDVLQPMQALRLLRWLQANAPQWVRYFVVCLFAGVRPDVREGEARRLDEDLRHPSRHLRRQAIDGFGFWVRGKTGKTRHVPWTLCGPLREWLNAYPGKGLVPDGLSYSQAERQLHVIRARFDLTHDIARHTAATAMINGPGASFAIVAMALDNSEAMLRAHYIGIWTPEMVPAFYAITPTSGPQLAPAAVA